ncbi:MAG: hypothetical protein JNJ99_13135 [Crocinitomicaceae bacterium]|nr:hypothetical protein [Crocinitomicaceae bacterium]
MKKLLFLPLALIAMAFTVSNENPNGCEGYWLVEKGITLEYKDYNSKDKLQGSQLSSITELVDVNGVLNVTLHSITKDDKDKVTSEGDYKFTCNNGEITIDMKAAMESQGQGMEEMEGMEVTIDQSNLVYPSKFEVGQTLPDGTMTMKVSSSGMVVMTMVTKITDRKVEAFESVTTPAGTFECVKMSQITHMDMGMMKSSTKSIDWFTLGVGSVRHESYDKNGALEGYRVLTQVIK